MGGKGAQGVVVRSVPGSFAALRVTAKTNNGKNNCNGKNRSRSPSGMTTECNSKSTQQQEGNGGTSNVKNGRNPMGLSGNTRQIQESLRCAPDGKAVRRFGRDDVVFFWEVDGRLGWDGVVFLWEVDGRLGWFSLGGRWALEMNGLRWKVVGGGGRSAGCVDLSIIRCADSWILGYSVGRGYTVLVLGSAAPSRSIDLGVVDYSIGWLIA
jgi:hypothetical protein